MNVQRADVPIFILLIGLASGVFGGFCPSWFTVSSPTFHSTEGNIRRIRVGTAAASAIVIATGFALSHTTQSKHALYVALFISLVYSTGYEYMMRNPIEGT